MVSYPRGARITGTLPSGDAFDGEVWAHDASSSFVCVRVPGEVSNTHDVRLINTSDVKDIAIADGRGVTNWKDRLPEVDDARRERRFANALKHAQIAADNIGENVSALAQDVFDALARTLPCRWESDVIVVMDEVRVHGPRYAEARGSGATAGAEERVQKVLANERAKLGV